MDKSDLSKQTRGALAASWHDAHAPADFFAARRAAYSPKPSAAAAIAHH